MRVICLRVLFRERKRSGKSKMVQVKKKSHLVHILVSSHLFKYIQSDKAQLGLRDVV